MPRITNPVEYFSGLAAEHMAESVLDESYPVPVGDAHREAVGAVQDTQAVATALEGKLQKLADDKVHMTAEGYNLLRRQAITEAQDLASEAARRYARYSEAAESALLDSSLPAIASDSRESLARQELQVALGDAKGPDASLRILGIAKSGSPEVQAVLGTPYARTVLIASGVANVDRVLTDARKVVAQLGTSPEAQKAAAGLAKVGKLGGAQASAMAAFRAAMPRQA